MPECPRCSGDLRLIEPSQLVERVPAVLYADRLDDEIVPTMDNWRYEDVREWAETWSASTWRCVDCFHLTVIPAREEDRP